MQHNGVYMHDVTVICTSCCMYSQRHECLGSPLHQFTVVQIMLILLITLWLLLAYTNGLGV